jgi:hypothetical protein
MALVKRQSGMKTPLHPGYGRFWDHMAGIGTLNSFQSPDFQAFFGRSAAAQSAAGRQPQAKPSHSASI